MLKQEHNEEYSGKLQCRTKLISQKSYVFLLKLECVKLVLHVISILLCFNVLLARLFTAYFLDFYSN